MKIYYTLRKSFANLLANEVALVETSLAGSTTVVLAVAWSAEETALVDFLAPLLIDEAIFLDVLPTDEAVLEDTSLADPFHTKASLEDRVNSGWLKWESDEASTCVPGAYALIEYLTSAPFPSCLPMNLGSRPGIIMRPYNPLEIKVDWGSCGTSSPLGSVLKSMGGLAFIGSMHSSSQIVLVLVS